MANTQYSSMVNRSLTDILGDTVSVLDYGAVGDGVTDDSAAFNLAITRLKSLGGRQLYIPGGRTYLLEDTVTFPAGVNNITVIGDGPATVLKRGAAMTSGHGLIDVYGQQIVFKHFAVEGNLTTTSGMLFSDIPSGDPMAAVLTDNTSFWIHGGAEDIIFDAVHIRHTGGYAILLDATSVGSIKRVKIVDCHLLNNRQYTFGTSSGDMNYGSWTGGIHYQGDGTTYAVEDLYITGCTFRRGTGNQIWGHLYAFSKMHSNVSVKGCHFEDIGRDGILIGGTVGGVVEGNTFRRIGYVVTNDSGASTPKWLNGQWAVGLDTAGLVQGVNYVNNTFVSCYGAAMDLDGYADGIVSGNSVVVPVSGSPEYTEDSIASWTNLYCYGAQISNSNNLATAAINVSIVNNKFTNCGLGAIRMYAARNCTANGNLIIHPATALMAPIVMGNIGTGDNQRANGNTVFNNTIVYDPVTPVGAVQEDDSLAAFQPTDSNWVFDNQLSGNCYEFYPSTTTASTTKKVFSTNSQASTKNEFAIQREGTGSSSALKGYTTISSTQKQRFQIQDYRDGSNEDSVFQVSLDGAADTGIVATGDRTSFGFSDLMATGKALSYGFAAILARDASAGSVYSDAEADALTDDWILLRADKATHKLQVSLTTLAGARVWTDLGGGGTPGGSDTHIQFNDSGAFGGESHLRYDKTNFRLGVGVVAAPAATLEVNGNTWLLSGNASDIVCIVRGATSQSGNLQEWRNVAGTTLVAIDPSGNFFGRGYTQFYEMTAPAVSGAGQARLYMDASTHKLMASVNGAAAVDLLAASGVTSLNTLTGAVSITAGTGVTVTPSSPNIAISIGQAVATSSNVTFASIVSSGNLTFGSGSQLVQGATVRIDTTGGGTFSAVQSSNTGTSITFQNVNTNFQVNGNGVVSCQQVNVAANTVINSSRQFVGTDVNVTGSVQSQASGTSIAFQTSNFNIQINGNGVVSCQQLNIAGSTCIDSSRNASFAQLTWTGQLRGPYTADTGLSFASSAGKIAYYDTSGTFKGWIPVLP